MGRVLVTMITRAQVVVSIAECTGLAEIDELAIAATPPNKTAPTPTKVRPRHGLLVIAKKVVTVMAVVAQAVPVRIAGVVMVLALNLNESYSGVTARRGWHA